MGSVSSLRAALTALAEYMAAVSSNSRAADAADELSARIGAAGHGSCTVDISWSAGEGATVCCVGRIDREAEIRKLFREVASEHGIELTEPVRRDDLKTYGSISVDYGQLKLRLSADGKGCKRVQVGVRNVPAHDEPVYEIVCGEPEASEEAQP